MSSIETLSTAGGLFVLLALNHATVDFVFQTHYEAMNKARNWKIRALHCAIYTVGFLPLLYVLGLAQDEVLWSVLVLFWSHFMEDTYLPVYWWAKHIRRVPEVRERGIQGFIEWVGTPLGKILMISIDQIIHLHCLWPIVFMAL